MRRIKCFAAAFALLASVAATGAFAAEAPKQESTAEVKIAEKPAAAPRPFEFSGYAQFLYTDNTASASGAGANLSRARFIGKKKIDDKLALFVQTNLTGNSDTASKLSLVDANIQYDLGGGRNLWLGQFILPFGVESPVAPRNLHMINYSQESINAEHEIAGDDLRDVGLRYNYAPKDGRFSLSAAVVNGEGINRKADTNDAKTFVGRLGYSFDKFFGAGVSGYEGKRYKAASAAVASYGARAGATGAGDFTKRRAALDATYKKDRLTLQGEYHLYRTGLQGRVSDLVGFGWFVQGGFYLSKTFELTLKRDELTPDRNDASTGKIVTASGFNWYFHKAAKMQFAYEKRAETPETPNDRVDALVCVDF